MAQRGFTLIELISVLVLVGIMAAYASSRFNRSDYETESAARELIEALRYAQAKAIALPASDADGDGNSDRYRVNLSSSGYNLVVDDINSTNLGAVTNPIDNSSYSQSWSSGITLAPSVSSISFNSRGEPEGLASDATISINGVTTITVEQMTGYIHR